MAQPTTSCSSTSPQQSNRQQTLKSLGGPPNKGGKHPLRGPTLFSHSPNPTTTYNQPLTFANSATYPQEAHQMQTTKHEKYIFTK